MMPRSEKRTKARRADSSDEEVARPASKVSFFLGDLKGSRLFNFYRTLEQNFKKDISSLKFNQLKFYRFTQKKVEKLTLKKSFNFLS